MTLATIRKYKNMQNEVNGIIAAREHNIHLAHRIRVLLESLYDAHFYQLSEKKIFHQDLRQARRAAQVDCFKQTGGSPFTVLSESYDGYTYRIEAEVR